jgi:hypothetical protein
LLVVSWLRPRQHPCRRPAQESAREVGRRAHIHSALSSTEECMLGTNTRLHSPEERSSAAEPPHTPGRTFCRLERQSRTSHRELMASIATTTMEYAPCQGDSRCFTLYLQGVATSLPARKRCIPSGNLFGNASSGPSPALESCVPVVPDSIAITSTGPLSIGCAAPGSLRRRLLITRPPDVPPRARPIEPGWNSGSRSSRVPNCVQAAPAAKPRHHDAPREAMSTGARADVTHWVHGSSRPLEGFAP